MRDHVKFGISHFGISEEELEYDGNDPSWFVNSPGSNVLNGRYDSAKPFLERLQRQQTSYLEGKVEEGKARREAIREKVSRDFEENLKQHLAELRSKSQSPLVLEKILLARQQQAFATKLSSKTDKHVAEFVTDSLAGASSLVSSPCKAELFKSAKSTSSVITTFETPAETFLPTIDASVTVISTVPSSTFTHSVAGQDAIANISSASSVKLQSSPFATSINRQSEIFLSSPLQKSITQITSSSNHATLTRTNSVFPTRLTTSRITSFPLQILEEKSGIKQPLPIAFAGLGATNQSTSKAAVISSEPNPLNSIIANEKSTDGIIRSCSQRQRHPVYDKEITFARDFMTKIISIPDSVKNELKRTIKERISVSTKKFAKQRDIEHIIRFFNNLLGGLTVYGFNDKMINLKDDGVSIDWAMIYIIDTYLDLVSQDMGLLEVVAAVLSSLAYSSTVFSKLLYGKLFIASSLLAVNCDECIRHVNQRKNSQTFAETLAAWNNREVAIIRLFIAIQTQNVGNAEVQEYDGLGMLWEIIVVTVSKDSLFGATLIAEILKHCWETMYNLYGRQMVKLIVLIHETVLPRWKASLNNLEENGAVRSVVEQYLTTLKFTVDECLSSFHS